MSDPQYRVIDAAAGMRWDDIPDDWNCPDCGAAKADFEMVEVARS